MFNEVHGNQVVYSYATPDIRAMYHKWTRSTRLYAVKNAPDTSVYSLFLLHACNSVSAAENTWTGVDCI